mgnify:CR=1 FL=1
MITLLLKYAKRVLTLLIVAFLLTTTVVTAKTNEYINYRIGTQVEQSVETVSVMQREYDVIIRVGEYSNKSGKRIYLDQVDVRWKDIPKDIPIHRDNSGYYIHEHDINLKSATKLYNELKNKGVNVKLQVANGKLEDLNAAAKISNKSNPKLYISCHHDYYNSTSKGYHAIYNQNDNIGKLIAQRLSNSIKDNGQVPQRDCRPNENNYIGELSHLNKSTCGVLLELGFFSSNELKEIVSDRYSDYTSTHLANEIVEILNDYWK